MARPSVSTDSAAMPLSSGARRSHAKTSLPSGPNNRASCGARAVVCPATARTDRRYSESSRSSASYIGSHISEPTGSSSNPAPPARSIDVANRALPPRSTAKCRSKAARTAAGSCSPVAASSSSVRRRTSSASATVALPCSVNGCGAGPPDGSTSVEYSGTCASRRAEISSAARYSVSATTGSSTI